jgi:hypothetical protein
MSAPRRLHAVATVVLSSLMVLVGVALVVRTLMAGGGAGARGVVVGLLFAAAGGVRLYLQLRMRDG